MHFGKGFGLLVWLGVASAANGSLFYEPFDYASGNLGLDTNTGSNTTWYSSLSSGADDRVQVVGGNLSAAGLPPSVGNMTSFGGAGRTDRIFFGQNYNSGTVYYSLLLRVSDLTGAAAGGATIAGFNNTAQTLATHDTAAQPSTISGRLIVKPVAANTYQLGIHKSAGTTAQFVFTDINSPFNVNDTLFLVGRYTYNTGTTTDDVFDLWVNPSSATFADDNLIPAPTISESLGNDTGQIATFILRQTDAVVPAGLQADELRVDSTWARVTSNLVPEPASALGMLACGGMLVLTRRGGRRET